VKNLIARLKQRAADVREARRLRAEERWDRIDPDGIVRRHDAGVFAGNSLRPLEARLRAVVEADEYAWGEGGRRGKGRLRRALELVQEEIAEALDTEPRDLLDSEIPRRRTR